MESNYTKHDIYENIEDFVKANLTLEQVKGVLQITYNCELSELDCCCVEDKYIELLMNNWLDDGPEVVISNVGHSSQILNFANSLSKLNSFEDCQKYCETCKFMRLIIDLSKKLIKLKDYEEDYVFRFKQRCLCNLFLQASDIKIEIQFIQCFVDVLKYSNNLEELCLELQIKDFLENKCTLKHILTKLDSFTSLNEPVLNLKQSGREVLKSNSFILTKDLKEIISDFIVPVTISELRVDGRTVLEVVGKHIIISKVLTEIEREPRFSRIDEVRFVHAAAIHADIDLKRLTWHGKNIVVYGETLLVSKDRYIAWDVSGNDSTHAVNTAETAGDGFGLTGSEGNPGESGGNILIIVDSIEGEENFTIISNGGNGSKGQDGGNGKDGKDGNFISYDDFIIKFPPVSKLKNELKLKHLHTTKESILLKSVKTVYWGGMRCGKVSNEQFHSIFSNMITGQNLEDFYFEVQTNNGCEIVFSFCYGDLWTFCQSFLLHKGSSGEEGKPGGTGGIGGRGGLAGSISIEISDISSSSNIKCIKINGKQGPQGKTGVFGKPGNSGFDIAYMDCSNIIRNNWPKTFVINPKDSKRLTIEYSVDKSSDTVFCPHNNLYGKVSKLEKNVTKKIQQQFGLKHTCPLQTAQGIRKKTIDKKSIIERYKQNVSNLNVQNLHSTMKHVTSILSEMITEQKIQTEQVIVEKRFKKQISYCSQKYSASADSNYSFKQLEKDINQLKNILMSPNNACNSNNNQWNQRNIRSSCDKYKLAVLEHIVNSCINQSFLKKDDENDIKLKIPEIICASFFKISEDPHPLIKEYFIEDSDLKRKSISNVSKRLKIGELCLKQSINVFINDLGDSFSTESMIKVLYKSNNLFKRDQENELISMLFPIKNLLLRTEFSELSDMLIKSIKEQCSEKVLAFKDKLEKHQFLNKLVKNYSKAKKPNDWINILSSKNADKTEEIKDGFSIKLKEKGPFASFYREFLAYYIDANILTYSVNEYNKMELISNHNPDKENILPILIKEGRFYQLQLDYKCFEMLEMHKVCGKLYSKILCHIDSFREKQQFDEFVSKSSFMSNAYTGLDKTESIRIKIEQILTQDKDIEVVISGYENKIAVRSRLEKLKLEHIGYYNILHFMALHFKTEGHHITTKEFYFVINFICRSSIFFPDTMPLICWIIAAYHQTHWLIEIALLKLELYFNESIESETKKKWRIYLSDKNEAERLMFFFEKINVDSSSKVSIQCVDEILYLFSSIPRAHIGIEDLDLSEWKYYLKDKYWVYQLAILTHWPEEDLNLASFYLMSLENWSGVELMRKFFDVLKKSAIGVNSKSLWKIILNVLKMLHSKEISMDDKLLQKLSNIAVNNWQKEIEVTCLASGKDRSLSQLIESISSANTSDKILNKLNNISESVEKCNKIITTLEKYLKDEIKLKAWISYLLKVLKWKKECDENKKERTNKEKQDKNIDLSTEKSLKLNTIVCEDWIRELFQSIFCINSSFGSNNTSCLKESFPHKISLNYLKQNLNVILLSTIVKTINIKVKHNILLRNTQILAILTLLESGKNILSQVSTGEGKSLIIVSVATIQAVQGQKVDIITSSHVLAERDAYDYQDVYNLFGVEVGHNCSDNIEERKKSYSNCQVVYGELANFQRDYLLDCIYDKNILGDRKFQNVLVDEVDSMMLDKGNNILYLSHDIPGLDKLEPLFVFIWKWLNKPSSTHETDTQINISELKDRVLFEIFGEIKKEHIKKLDINLSPNQIDNIWNILITEKVITSNGRVTNQDIEHEELASKTEHLIEYGHLSYLLRKVTERERSFVIPNYLKCFVEAHLEEWIKSAIRALCMENGRDYVVDIDRSSTSVDRSPNITIVDHDTGTDQLNCQWDEALHQFLQLKHGCKLSLISLKAVFISNVSYLKLYDIIYGLSGTLGSCRERELLKEIYDVDIVTIPTAKVKSFIEKLPIVCSDRDKWASIIFNEVYEIAESRSVLVICETVNDVLYLKKHFNKAAISSKESYCRKIHTYTRDYEELSIAKDLMPGHIIISTNLAGRGTDIKLSPKLIDAGGLHVCLTYLPSNSRVEEQAYGRSARNGEPGSAQMIFIGVRKNNPSKIVDIKKQRDFNENLRITDIKKYYDNQIKHEEKYFDKFKESYCQLKNSNHFHDDIKSILLQSCLDQWAFWLDTNAKHISSVSAEDFTNSIKELNSEKFDSWSKYVNNPFQLIKLGVAYLKIKEYGKSNSLFERAIKEEAYFSEAAYYYKLCAITGKEELKTSDLLDDSGKDKLKTSDLQGDSGKDKLKTSDLVDDSGKEELKTSDILGDSEKEELKTSELLDDSGKEELKTSELLGDSGKEELKISSLLSDLEIVKQKLKERVNSTLLSAYVIDWLKNRNSGCLLQIDSYKEQQINVSNMYSIFLQSIFNIIGHELSFTDALLPITTSNQYISYKLYNDLLDANIIKQKLKGSITDSDLSFATKSFGTSAKEIRQILGKYENKYIEKELLRDLKNCLPTRELFWKELLFHGVLKNEEKYVFIDLQKLNCTLPSLKGFFQGFEELSVDICKIKGKCIWFYNAEEFEPLAEQQKYSVLKTQKLKTVIGNKLYNYLKIINVIYCNKRATISHPFKIDRFEHFDTINVNDFEKIGVVDNIVSKVIADLKKNRVINDSCKGYSLNINADETHRIQLSTYKAYEDDVKTLLTTSFAFRIAFQEMNYLMLNHDDFKTVCLPLPSKLHKQLLEKIKEEGIITGPIINCEKDILKSLKDLYPKSMDRKGWDGLFSEFYTNKTTRSNVIDKSIEINWLSYPIHQVLTKENQRKYHINRDNIPGSEVKEKTKPSSEINVKIKMEQSSESIVKEKIDQSSTSEVKEEMKPSNFILLTYMALYGNIENIERLLESKKGSLYKVAIPSFILEPLSSILHKQNMPTSEYATFSLDGFDEVITIEEKRWSWKMKRSACGVLALGITETAVGAVLTYCFPMFATFGGGLLQEGMNDMVYALRCFYSGNFSSSDYRLNKLISLILSFYSSMLQVAKLFKSTYAQGIGLSFETIKANCSYTGLKKVGSAAKGLFYIPKNTEKKTLMKAVTKRVISVTAMNVARSTVYSTLDEVIEPQMMKLGEVIAKLINSNIEVTICNHPVIGHVKDIYQRFGKENAQNVINTCFEKTIQQNQDTNKRNWQITFSLLNSFVQEHISNLTEKGFSNVNCSSIPETAYNIYLIVSQLIELVKQGTNYFVHINNLVSKMLNDLATSLQEHNAKCHLGDKTIHPKSETDIGYSQFIWETTSDWKSKITILLSDHINEMIISPVLQATTNHFIEYSERILYKKCDTFFTAQEIHELGKYKNKYLQTNETSRTDITKRPDFAETDYNEFLLELFKKKRSSTVFTEIMRKKLPVDANCIEVCCKVIPLALSREGLPVPKLEIILEFDGVQESYRTVEADISVLTIIISPNEGLLKNIGKNKFCVKSVIDIVCCSLLKNNPKLIGITSDVLYKLILQFLESDIAAPFFGNTYDTNESQNPSKPTTSQNPSKSTTSQNSPKPSINTKIEQNIAYQHSHNEGRWKFIPLVDVDLRKENKFKFLSDVENQIQEGFKIAVKKINLHIFTIQDYLKSPFSIDLEEFSETKHKIVPQTKDTTVCDFHCYPVQYELVIPLPIESSNKLVNFKVTMSLKDKTHKVQPYSPHGPHILYEIQPITDIKHISKGVKGHVLLNEECQERSFSVSDCVVAGDLIMPSRYNYQEPINILRAPKIRSVLIVGDSFIRCLSGYFPRSMQVECETICYPEHTKSCELNSQIDPLIKQFTGVKCIVLYMGNSSITKAIEDEVANDIGQTVIEIQSHLENASIIVCSLLLQPHSANNRKIEKINKFLYSFCVTMNIIYLDINLCLGLSDISMNGVTLTKRGYFKLGQHIVGTIKSCCIT